MTRDFMDDIVVVTGGTRGIGRAVASTFAAEGAQTIASYRTDTAAAAETAAALDSVAPGSQVIQCDVRDFDAVEAMFADVAAQFGPPTIVINNAGMRQDGLLVRMSAADWDAVIETNLTGTFNCTRHAARLMLGGDGGCIVNVASIAGMRGWAGQANYAASKAGIIGFTRAAARELGGKQIRINAVAPGFTDTSLFDTLGADRRQREIEKTPQERIATPEEIAEAIAYLACPGASFVNGEILRVDGGRLA